MLLFPVMTIEQDKQGGTFQYHEGQGFNKPLPREGLSKIRYSVAERRRRVAEIRRELPFAGYDQLTRIIR